MIKVLTNAAENIRISDWKHEGDGWSIHKFELHGGRQDGVDLIVVDNGKLRLTVIPTRGMSIFEVTSGDLRLGWDSPVKEIVHPKYINLESRGGLGWLEGFNEWMVRCGLEYAGHPGQDKFINNVGDEATMDLTLHGKIGNIPASKVKVVVDDRIRIQGIVEERMFYGAQLELSTEISTKIGSTAFSISDRITNRGASDQEFEIIYHANHGPPLLEEDSQFIAPVKRVTPMNQHAAGSIDQYNTYDEPTPGFVEQVYLLAPYADDSNRTTVMLRNAAGDKGVAFSYSIEQLPHLTLWKNTLSKQNGYVTGIEPGTSFPYNRRIERQAGRLPMLAAGGSRQFDIDFRLLIGSAAVEAKEVAKKKIRDGRPTQLDSEPPETSDQ